jgi:hypothetical protein
MMWEAELMQIFRDYERSLIGVRDLRLIESRAQRVLNDAFARGEIAEERRVVLLFNFTQADIKLTTAEDLVPDRNNAKIPLVLEELEAQGWWTVKRAEWLWR